MNKIQEFVNTMDNDKKQKEKKLLLFSEIVSKLINVKPSELKKTYSFDKWKIVSNHRLLSDEWYELFEIIPKEYDDQLGYSNAENPDWVEVKGTRSIILMPEEMIKEFLLDLIEHLKE